MPRPGTELAWPVYSPSTPPACQAFEEYSLLWISPQMEDGHTLFDYDVRLNDTIQLLVRQSLALPLSTKERDSELSDSDSGYGVGHSESDKSSMHGEGAAEGDDKTVWEDTDLGLYKVRFHVAVCRCVCGFLGLSTAQIYTLPTLAMPAHHCTDRVSWNSLVTTL